jgi:Flp pilus assembly protein TadG
MKESERGTVIVLTLAGLTAILGVIGLAIDLGLMFDYKQRAQTAADAAALAAALSPTDYQAAALEMSKANGFENNVGSIRVNAVTPPVTGGYTASGNKDKYFEVIIKEEYPTYFLKMISIKSFPIEARAVAGIGGTGGNCMAVGDSTTENSLNLTAPNCKLYFSSLDDQGNITANQININQPNPPDPGTFPSSSSFNCTTEVTCGNSTLNPGCYKKITVDGKNCLFTYGAFYIKESLKFENNGEATNSTSSTGDGVTFFLESASSFDFNGKATLSSSAAPNFKDVLFWSKGSGIEFGSNSKASLIGLIYAPGVTTKFAGKIDLDIPSGGNGGASNIGLLVE